MRKFGFRRIKWVNHSISISIGLDGESGINASCMGHFFPWTHWTGPVTVKATVLIDHFLYDFYMDLHVNADLLFFAFLLFLFIDFFCSVTGFVYKISQDWVCTSKRFQTSRIVNKDPRGQEPYYFW